MRRWFFPCKFTFTWIAKRPVLDCLCIALKKIFFFQILALLHYVSSRNVSGYVSRHISEADLVQKCEDLKKIFFSEQCRESRTGRFAIHVKVNIHGKNQRLIYFLEGCNLAINRAVFFTTGKSRFFDTCNCTTFLDRTTRVSPRWEKVREIK